MNRKTRWRAKMMARMARDGDVESLAEMITELMEEPVADEAEEAETVQADPVTEPLAATVLQAVAEEANESQAAATQEGAEPVQEDCGREILETLRRILDLVSVAEAMDCRLQGRQADEGLPGEEEAVNIVAAESANEIGEAAALTAEALEASAEAVAGAAAEALGIPAENLADPSGAADEADEGNGAGAAALPENEDPVESLVADILEPEGENSFAGAAGPEILSSILDPEEAADEDGTDPDGARAADTRRTALAVFRPQLSRMSPRERKRFNADVAARMKRMTRSRAAGKPDPYAALRAGAARDRSARSLGEKIMAARNANLQK